MIITRAEAKQQNLTHYYTGKPCGRGHTDYRFTSIGKCKTCAREDTMRQHIHTTTKRRSYTGGEGFVIAATNKHNGVYLYDKVNYVNPKTPVEITCKIHGNFMCSPTNHIQGQGCKQCAYEKLIQLPRFQPKPLATFIQDAIKVHGDKFDYSYVEYKGAKISVLLQCKAHPETLYRQQPSNHLSGQNPCLKCGHATSKAEQEVFKYVSSITTAYNGYRDIQNVHSVDIYIPSANLAVEFHGMYWHSHFNAEDEKANKNKSYNKYKECADKGVRLITIYETEWQQRQPQIKRLLRNAIGKTKGKLMARKCQLGEVSTQEAKEFYDRYHPQGGEGAGKHYGLFWKGKLVACMRFAVGSNDRGHNTNRVWTLARFATRVNVLGGASKLFKAFVKDEQPEIIKSFSDNRYFSGGMYEQLGFTMELESQPDYQVWSQKIGLKPKTHYQRRALQKRLNDHNINEVYNHEIDPRTEKEMTYLMGAGRIYDCGKKRWVWTP